MASIKGSFIDDVTFLSGGGILATPRGVANSITPIKTEKVVSILELKQVTESNVKSGEGVGGGLLSIGCSTGFPRKTVTRLNH